MTEVSDIVSGAGAASRGKPQSSRPRLCYVVTSAITAASFLRGQLACLRRQGFGVHLVTSPGPELSELLKTERVALVELEMRREISPYQDLISGVRLVSVIRRLRPLIVNASTPKAGLLGILAAWLTGVPIRVYTLRGLRLETATGFRRGILSVAERIAAACATDIVCVSASLRQRVLELGLAREAKIRVLGAGSSNGVDCDRFRSGLDRPACAHLRQVIGLGDNGPVIGFVGRLTRDKGIEDLLVAWNRIRENMPDCRLLLVGDLEAGDPIDVEVRRRLDEAADLVRIPWAPNVEDYYQLMDVVAFPSHREGMPNVPLEAAASGIPVVGYRVTGTVDAVEDGITGRLVESGQVDALAECLLLYLQDRGLAQRHGEAGRRRVESLFRREKVWENLASEYRRLLRKKGLPPPSSPSESRESATETERTA